MGQVVLIAPQGLGELGQDQAVGKVGPDVAFDLVDPVILPGVGQLTAVLDPGGKQRANGLNQIAHASDRRHPLDVQTHLINQAKGDFRGHTAFDAGPGTQRDGDNGDVFLVAQLLHCRPAKGARPQVGIQSLVKAI